MSVLKRGRKTATFGPRYTVALCLLLAVSAVLSLLAVSPSGKRLLWQPQGQYTHYRALKLHSKCTGERRYLVTGAAGFIGFHAASVLSDRGDTVIGVDNFNDYYPVSLKRARAQVLEGKGVPVIEADLNDPKALADVFQQCSFTHVIHMAAQAGVRYATKNPDAYISSNIAGSVHLLEAMKSQQPPPALIFASSSSVYGLTKRTPFTEDDRADVPASLYAATKRSQELITHTYYHLYGISATGLRFFTVYGPWGRPDMSVMSFARNILEGKPIKVFQGPEQSELARDFTFVGDIVAGVMAAADTTPPSIKGTAEFRVFNLGNTHSYTVSEMVNILQDLLGKKAQINYVPVPQMGDVLRTHANISAAREAFGYQPKTNLQEGLAKFVAWYKDYYGADGLKRPADEQHYVPD